MSDNQAQNPSTTSNPASHLIAAITKQPASPQGTRSSIGDDENLIAESIRAEQKLQQQQQQRLASPSITQSPPSTRVHTPKAPNNLSLPYLPKEGENQSSPGMADVTQVKQDSVDTSELVTSTANSESIREQLSSNMSHPNDEHDRRESRDDKEHGSAHVRRRGLMREESFDSEMSSAEDSKRISSTSGISSPTSMAAAAAAVADAVARSNISARESSGAQNPLSPSSISHQAQYTFSSPSPDVGSSKHRRTSSGNTGNVPRQSEGSIFSSRASPSMNLSPTYQPSPSFSQQMEEDVHMSESPSADDHLSLTGGASGFHRSTHDLSGNLSDSGVFRHRSTMQRRGSDTRQQMSPNPTRSSTSPLDGDDSPSTRDGVSMSAKSAILYHAGYNSGRGAVWRFFKVVESRVSGNTDRAECLLCQKRMLGKSADMKKHIVQGCPQKGSISEDMLPILEIVRTELENPKKRAKRNSNTPIVMRADGSFAPVPNTPSSTSLEPAPISTRVHTVSGTPSAARSLSFQRPTPYDVQYDVQRAKMAKYSR
ncbi:hypothetical protein IW140_004433 [Coemansia sp. RSA 1813]|nr:hypothetical protein LPJ74_003306 [Coemansia sp. RSA 1843]KAJ2567525.1 hypothetical protein IW140_004433 [Coemansia sp. RSA 1813]